MCVSNDGYNHRHYTTQFSARQPNTEDHELSQLYRGGIHVVSGTVLKVRTQHNYTSAILIPYSGRKCDNCYAPPPLADCVTRGQCSNILSLVVWVEN